MFPGAGRISIVSPGCLVTDCVDHAGLDPTDPLLPSARIQALATLLGLNLVFKTYFSLYLKQQHHQQHQQQHSCILSAQKPKNGSRKIENRYNGADCRKMKNIIEDKFGREARLQSV